MGYNRSMRTSVHCACGWQRSLSPYYAGKQLRCPQCERVVTADGADQGGAYHCARGGRGGPVAPLVRVVYVPVAAPRMTGGRAAIWLAIAAALTWLLILLATGPNASAPATPRPAVPAPAAPPAHPPAAPAPQPSPPAAPERDLEREDEF